MITAKTIVVINTTKTSNDYSQTSVELIADKPVL